MQFPLEMQIRGKRGATVKQRDLYKVCISWSSCPGCSATVRAGALSKITNQQSGDLIQQYPNLPGHARPLLKQEP